MSLADKIKDYLNRDDTSEMSIHTDSYTLFLGKYPPNSTLSQEETKGEISNLIMSSEVPSHINTNSETNSQISEKQSHDELLSELKELVGKNQVRDNTINNVGNIDSNNLQIPPSMQVRTHTGGNVSSNSALYKGDIVRNYVNNYDSDSDISIHSYSSVDM